jgi:hypothetical protein
MARMVIINHMFNNYLTNLTLNSTFEIIPQPLTALKFLTLKAFFFFMFTSIFSFYRTSLSSIDFSNFGNRGGKVLGLQHEHFEFDH